MVSNENLSHEREFPYRGSAFLLWFWLVWSILGYFFIVGEGEGSVLYQVLYIISAIMAAMGLNNRMYGINHRILFYADHIVLPKLIHLWHWEEEKIFYKDIQDIRFAPLSGSDGNLEIGEIELKTPGSSYPIFYHKLPVRAMQDILKLLGEKTGLKGSMMSMEEWAKPGATAPSAWQWRMAGLALVVSIWAVVSISVAEQYHLILGPNTIFLYPFLISGTGALLLHRKIGQVDGQSKRWQKFFLLLYFTFYGGISLAFSLIYLNGALDTSTAIVSAIPVTTQAQFDERKKAYCIEVAIPSNLGSDGRAIASTDSLSSEMLLCRPEFEKAEKGTQIKLSIRKGAFLGPWISDMEVAPTAAPIQEANE